MNKKRNRSILRAQNRPAFKAMVERKREAGDLPPLDYIAPTYRGSLSGKAAESEKE